MRAGGPLPYKILGVCLALFFILFKLEYSQVKLYRISKEFDSKDSMSNPNTRQKKNFPAALKPPSSFWLHCGHLCASKIGMKRSILTPSFGGVLFIVNNNSPESVLSSLSHQSWPEFEVTPSTVSYKKFGYALAQHLQLPSKNLYHSQTTKIYIRIGAV